MLSQQDQPARSDLRSQIESASLIPCAGCRRFASADVARAGRLAGPRLGSFGDRQVEQQSAHELHGR